MTEPHPATVAYANHVNPAFVRLLGVLGYGRVFVRAQGTTLWDEHGRPYLDFLAGFGATPLGHNHPRLLAQVGAFLQEGAPNLVHTGIPVHASMLAQALAERAGPPLSRVLFSNSGSEAVEAGLKLARAATGRRPFLYCTLAYHGTGLGALSVMGVPRLRQPFEPLLPDCIAVPFGDLGALRKALGYHLPAAFLVEPILAEGGVVVPPAGYLQRAQALCREHGTLLVLDEVQTGLGRTGADFAFRAEGFVPDVLALAKALGGGLCPIAATLTSGEIMDRAYGTMERFDLHGTTYAGNALCCAAALATLRILDEDGLYQHAAQMGTHLLQRLRERLAGHRLVRDIRGRGLLVGVELGGLGKDVLGQWLALRLLERGVVAQPASQRWSVLKLEPPLTVTAAEIDRAVEDIGAVLDDYSGPVGMSLWKDVVLRLGQQALSGGRFR